MYRKIYKEGVRRLGDRDQSDLEMWGYFRVKYFE